VSLSAFQCQIEIRNEARSLAITIALAKRSRFGVVSTDGRGCDWPLGPAREGSIFEQMPLVDPAASKASRCRPITGDRDRSKCAYTATCTGTLDRSVSVPSLIPTGFVAHDFTPKPGSRPVPPSPVVKHLFAVGPPSAVRSRTPGIPVGFIPDLSAYAPKMRVPFGLGKEKGEVVVLLVVGRATLRRALKGL
jgi:hypothetical protein